MPSNPIESKLAALLSADVVGYGRLMAVTLALGVAVLGCTTSTSAPENKSATQPILAAEDNREADPFDRPPADLRSEELVRCLIDTPEGCTGCDQGDTCVYQQMKEYDCVYIVYGTKCDD